MNVRVQAPPTVSNAAPLPDRRTLLLMRIWALLAQTRSCAKYDYQQTTDLPELQSNLIGLIGNFGNVTSTELVRLTGRDKGQISHAIANLVKNGLVHRSSLRAPIELTSSGNALFEQLVEIAQGGDTAITRGIPRVKLANFLSMVQQITDRAAAVLADEQAIEQLDNSDSPGSPDPTMSTYPSRLRDGVLDRPLSMMVAPRLTGLFAYLERGAALTYRRLFGLSLFETIIISQIGDEDELPLAELIALTDRNKGQVGRTVKQLEEEGLVEHCPSSTARRTILRLTEKGRALSHQMVHIAVERDEVLLNGISQANRGILEETLAELTANASLRLKAFREETAPPRGD